MNSSQDLFQRLVRPGTEAIRETGESIDLVAEVQAVAKGLQGVGAEGGLVVISAGRAMQQLVDVLGTLAAGAVAYPVSSRVDALAEAEEVGASAVVADGVVQTVGEARSLPEGAAVILRTSGSTGSVRRVVLSAAGISANLEAILAYLPVERFPRTGIVLPFSYSYALIGQAFATLAAGGTVIGLHSPYPALQVERACAQGVQGLSSVAASLRAFVEVVADLPASERPALRYLASAGGPLPRQTAERLREFFPSAQLWGQYGLTEASPRVLSLSSDDARLFEGAAGFPLPGLRVWLDEGELVIDTPAQMLGYLDEPEATATKLAGGLRSGDRAKIDPDGCVWILGRADDLVNLGGERVSLATLQMALEDAVPHPLWVGVCKDEGEPVLGCVVEHPSLEIRTWRRAARSLPVSMRPSRWLAVSQLPRLPAGKLDRRALQQLLEADQHG